MNRWHPAGFVAAVAFLLYPLLVYFFLDRVDPRWFLGLALVLLGWRGLSRAGGGPFLLAGGLVAGLLLWGREISVLLYPVLVNGVFLLWFLGSLVVFPPSVVERLARLTDPHLPPEGVRYTRRVTWVWCGFFLVNGTIAAVTVWLDDRGWWLLYNGLIAYLLMGLLMSGEYWMRRRLMRGNGHG